MSILGCAYARIKANYICMSTNQKSQLHLHVKLVIGCLYIVCMPYYYMYTETTVNMADLLFPSKVKEHICCGWLQNFKKLAENELYM